MGSFSPEVCPNLHAALSAAAGPELKIAAVKIRFTGTHNATPYGVAAPDTPGTLLLQGTGADTTTIDGEPAALCRMSVYFDFIRGQQYCSLSRLKEDLKGW